MPLPNKNLGRNGPAVPALGFGLMGLSAFAGETLPDDERLKVLDRAYELGETFWDTSDIYGDSEILLGKWFAANPDKRKDIFLATKFGGEIYGDVKKGEFRLRNDEEWVIYACNKSLERMGIDYVDLYYAHRLDGNVPVEKTVRAMATLIDHGKVKHIGLCEVSAKTLLRAHKTYPITAVQVEYSPFSLDIQRPEIGILRTCQELGIGLIAYSPLARGMLTGAIKSAADFEPTDVRRYYPRFSAENFPKNLRLVDELQSMATKKHCTTGQLTLAWLMAQDGVIPIPGTRKIKYLEENVGSVNVSLADVEMAEIQTMVDNAEVHGDRYPEAMAIQLFADTAEE